MNNVCCDIKIAIMYRKDQNPQAQKWNDGGGRKNSFWSSSFIYRTRAIIARSRFETTLDYKPQILGPTFFVYELE